MSIVSMARVAHFIFTCTAIMSSQSEDRVGERRRDSTGFGTRRRATASRRCRATPAGPHRIHLEVYSATFSPDGQKIMSASWDTTVRVWSAVTGECDQTVEGHTVWLGDVGGIQS